MLKGSTFSTRFFYFTGVILSLIHIYIPSHAMEPEVQRIPDGQEVLPEAHQERRVELDVSGEEQEQCQHRPDLEAVDSENTRAISSRYVELPDGEYGFRIGNRTDVENFQKELHEIIEENQGVLEDCAKRREAEESSRRTLRKSTWVAGGLALAAGVVYWFKDELLSVMETVGLRDPEDSDDEDDSDEQDELEIKAGLTTQQKAALGLATAGGAAATYYAYQNREALSHAVEEKKEQVRTYVRENPGKVFVGGALAGALVYGLKSLSEKRNTQQRPSLEEKKAISLISYMQQHDPPVLAKQCKAEFEKLHSAFVTAMKSKSLRQKLDFIISRVKAMLNPTYYFCYEFERELTDEQRVVLWQSVQYFLMNIVPHMKLDTVEDAHYAFLGALGHVHYTNQLFEAYRQFVTEKTIAYYSPMALHTDEEKRARKEFITALVVARQKFGW